MDDINRFCVSCFGYTLDSNGVCSHCGFAMGTEAESPHHLPMRSVLGGKYLCGRVLGEGGFGITYVGWDINLEVKVAIKEYYPQGAAIRNTTVNDSVSTMAGNMAEVFQQGREKFIDEAKRLAKFHNLPGIVLVRDFFQENNTAYIVMEFVQGVTLKDYLDSQGGRLPCDIVLNLFRPLIESLGQVHKTGIIHRDISPDNIMVMQNGQLCLIDFGAARDFTENNHSLSVLLKPGYAPEEQYRSRGNQGPWTDVYALCATLYRAIEGEKPPEALERIMEDSLHAFTTPVPDRVAQAIYSGLAPRQGDRLQSTDSLFEALYGAPISAPGSVYPKTISPSPTARPQNQAMGAPKASGNKKKQAYIVVTALVLVLAITLGVALSTSQKGESTDGRGPSGQSIASTPEGTEIIGGPTLSAGDSHSMSLNNESTLWGWGWNEFGQLGDGTNENRQTPVRIMDNVLAVSAGSLHTAAIKQDGSLWAWGLNEFGQLGDGTNENQNTPVRIMEDVQSVSAGVNHTMVIKQDGSLWAWGLNESGQLGDGTKATRFEPVRIMEDVKMISTGYFHSIAMKTDGSLWGWGDNKLGQLGNGNSENQAIPVKIMDGVQVISAGYGHTMAIKQDGSLWAWGLNESGQLGDGTTATRFEPVKIMEDVQSISAGALHTTAIKQNDSLWAWGDNEFSQLGDGTNENQNTPVTIMENVQIASAGGHTLAVKKDGSMFSCGFNLYGQLGDGTTENRSTLVQIFLPGEGGVEQENAVENTTVPKESEPDMNDYQSVFFNGSAYDRGEIVGIVIQFSGEQGTLEPTDLTDVVLTRGGIPIEITLGNEVYRETSLKAGEEAVVDQTSYYIDLEPPITEPGLYVLTFNLKGVPCTLDDFIGFDGLDSLGEKQGVAVKGV